MAVVSVGVHIGIPATHSGPTLMDASEAKVVASMLGLVAGAAMCLLGAAWKR